MKKQVSCNSGRYFMFAFFAVLSLFSYYYIFFIGHRGQAGLTWCDFITQRAVCEYTLKGFNVYALRGTSFAEDIYMGFHAVPWGCFLGNIFYPGFLSLEAGKIYFLFMNITVLIAASYIFYRKAKAVSGELGFFALMMSLLSVDFLFALYMGNGGFIVCAFMLIAWALCDEHPYLAGALIGLAMIKPQTAGLFCLSMLLMKHIKPLIIGAAVDIAAWLAVSVITNTGMLELLYEFLFSSDSLSMTNAGVFSFAFSNQLVSMGMSMMLGIIFVSVLQAYTPENVPEYFRIYPAMLASAFWCYGNITEGYVLLLPAVICLWMMMKQHSELKRFTWFSLCVWCAYGPVIRSVMRRILHTLYRTLAHDSVISRQLPRTVYEIGLIAIGIMICIELRQTYMEDAQ